MLILIFHVLGGWSAIRTKAAEQPTKHCPLFVGPLFATVQDYVGAIGRAAVGIFFAYLTVSRDG